MACHIILADKKEKGIQLFVPGILCLWKCLCTFGIFNIFIENHNTELADLERTVSSVPVEHALPWLSSSLNDIFALISLFYR